MEKEDFDDLETEEIGYSPEAKTIMEYAVEQAQALGHDYIGTEHILLGIIYDTESIGTKNSEADSYWLSRLLDDDTTLFEDLFRIYMKEPERLQDIQKLVQDLGGEDSAHIPKEFIQLWYAFEQAIKGKK